MKKITILKGGPNTGKSLFIKKLLDLFGHDKVEIKSYFNKHNYESIGSNKSKVIVIEDIPNDIDWDKFLLKIALTSPMLNYVLVTQSFPEKEFKLPIQVIKFRKFHPIERNRASIGSTLVDG